MSDGGATADLLLSLSGQAALVAGGSGGIGAAVVRRLGECGARVVSVDRPGIPAPVGAAGLEADLSSPEVVGTVLDRATEMLGGLDLLVHCAGITRDGMLWKLTDEAWSDVLRANLDSAFWLLRGAAPLLRARGGGSVVLISSINGERGKLGQANYAASKAGLLGLMKTAARELGRFGIRVNAVAPGFIETAMTASLSEEVRDAARQETALGRLGQPDDVARAVLFLAAPLARHVTGQVLRVDGGQLMA